MGGLIAKLKEMLFNKKLELVLVGLEKSGKSTFANYLAYGEPKNVLPTIGLSVKYVKKNSTFSLSLRFNHENLGSCRTTTV